MHIYLYEPRADRLNGLMAELRSARMKPVPIQANFFRGELGLLNRGGHEDRPFLLAESPDLLDQIAALRAAGCSNPVLVMRDFRNSRDTAAALDAGADDDIVIGRFAGPMEVIEHQGHCCCGGGARQRVFGGLRRYIVVGELQSLCFGFSQQPVPVHGDTVPVAQI